MVISNSYVSLPEGISKSQIFVDRDTYLHLPSSIHNGIKHYEFQHIFIASLGLIFCHFSITTWIIFPFLEGQAGIYTTILRVSVLGWGGTICHIHIPCFDHGRCSEMIWMIPSHSCLLWIRILNYLWKRGLLWKCCVCLERAYPIHWFLGIVLRLGI